jgi:hypothetical protein
MSNFADIASDVTNKAWHGSATVDMTAMQIPNSAGKLTRGVQLRAHKANTDIIYVGVTPLVTANTDEERDGFPLSANEGLFVPFASMDLIHVIADVDGQKLFWFAV